MFIVRVLILLFFIFLERLAAQDYPDWFLFPGGISVENLSTGYSNKSFYQDSAYSAAYRNSLENFKLFNNNKITGSQKYWISFEGTMDAGRYFNEIIDSSNSDISLQKLKAFNYANLLAVLVVDEKITEINVSEKNDTSWVTKIPEETGFLYSLGISKNYYYEKNSWLEAEKNARINLAKQISVKIKSLSKKENNFIEEARKEEVAVELKKAKIWRRYKDCKKKLYYVLVRMVIN